MATTYAHAYGAAIDGDSYTAQFEGANEAAKMNYTGGTYTKSGMVGPLFRLDADAGGSSSGSREVTLPGTSYDVIFIETSQGVVVEQEPL